MSRPSAIVRILDANANRAIEGLRVCEEIVRFSLEEPAGFARLRRLRHAVAGAVAGLPVSLAARLRARGSDRDVGRRASAGRVASLEQSLVINFQRVKESLRMLEECARLLAPRKTAAFQRLRFHAYDLARQILIRVAAVRHR